MSREARRPFVFIGSSSEGHEIAEVIQQNLDSKCEVQIWSQDAFDLGSGTLENLVKRIDDYDFAILVMTPDDKITTRDKKAWAPRDNVIFELGLFMGRISPLRTFIVHERDFPPKLPSDLNGITTARFSKPKSGNLRSSLGSVCTTIIAAINKMGLKMRTAEGAGMLRINIDIYCRERGFDRNKAMNLAEKFSASGANARIMQHSSRSQPDAIFIGALISADEARFVLDGLPHEIKYIFPPAYPESEGGAADGRKIGVGYLSNYNAGINDVRMEPAKISKAQLSKLLAPSISSAEFHCMLNTLFMNKARQ